MKVLAEMVLAMVLLGVFFGTCVWLLDPPRLSSTPSIDDIPQKPAVFDPAFMADVPRNTWDSTHGARGSWRLWKVTFGPNRRHPHGHTLTAWPLSWSTEAQCAQFRAEKLRQTGVDPWDPSTHIAWICAPLTPDT
jgi:hypothetical protein